MESIAEMKNTPITPIPSPTTTDWNKEFIVAEDDWIDKIRLTAEEVKRVKTVVLSGGGVNGLIHLGAIYHLTSSTLYKDLLNTITTFYGTSVGSIISYLLAIGFTPIEVLIHLINNPISVEFPNILKLLSADKTFGLYKWKILEDQLVHLTMCKLQYIPTLRDVYDRFGKRLIIVTYNKSKERTEYLSMENHGELSCLIAIRMSSSIPVVFEKFVYRGDVYIDGACSDNYAVQEADSKTPRDEFILGFNIVYKKVLDYEPKNILEYILWIMTTPLSILYDVRSSFSSDRCKTITLTTENSNVPDLRLDIKKFITLFAMGVRMCKEQVDTGVD